MKNISLSIVYENSQKRASGYMEEALRLGRVVSSWLEISEDNYRELESRFALGSKIEIQREVVNEVQEEVQQEVQEEVQEEVTSEFYKADNSKQNRARGHAVGGSL